ncbi:MAG: hypothetical protein PHS32_20915 [Rhodoferax sp.]|uniref:hypothetical protein n=1 Tax=Rhodoferax sp. TaxID=50421 RepID=UPI00261C0428|nr:hypothetical protein [Rhodoferax sp.]MDD5336205.1 hypothetical protein [Rhodoferax sp.]
MKTLSNGRLRRKAARELLRDAQLPELSSQSRAVLAAGALRLCAPEAVADIEAYMSDCGGWTEIRWQESCDELIANAKEMLKSI